MQHAPSPQPLSYDGVPSPSNRLTPSPPRAATFRRGSMLVETAIGIALAIVVMVAVAQLIVVIAKQRRETTDTRHATQTVANVMERMMVLPWVELTTESAGPIIAAHQTAAALQDPQLSIDVTNLDDALPTKKIEIALSWRDHANRRVEPVRLVAWKHQPVSSE